jgi:hypothetical protein
MRRTTILWIYLLAAAVLYANPQTSLPEIVAVKSNLRLGYAPFSVYFFCVPHIGSTEYSMVWDFGDKASGFGSSVMHIFTKPGKYPVKLRVLDQASRQISSGSLEIVVLEKTEANLKRWNLDAENGIFITAYGMDDIIDLSGKLFDKYGNRVEIPFDAKIREKPRLLKQIGYNKFKPVATGFSRFDIIRDDATYTLFIFVSPFPSVHCKEADFNWYKTQFQTGIWGNCGPAAAAMVVHWAKSRNVTVEDVREDIGYPVKNGAVTLEHLQASLLRFKVKSRIVPAARAQDYFDIIDRGNIVLIGFDTTYIRRFKGDKTAEFTDRYYNDTTGHYTVIKGYSTDKKYMIVYDPIPGDWAKNAARYLDGVSMIGRNRYFATEDILRSNSRCRAIEAERD